MPSSRSPHRDEVACEDCGIIYDKAVAGPRCPNCDSGYRTVRADGGQPTDDSDEIDRDRIKRNLPDFDGDVALTAWKHDGEVFTFTGDYGHVDDPDAFVSETVADLVGKHYRRDDGDVVELLGDFCGFAVYRQVESGHPDVDGRDPRTDGRVFKVTWPRFWKEFEETDDGAGE